MLIYLDLLESAPAAEAYRAALRESASGIDLRLRGPEGPRADDLRDAEVIVAGSPVDALLALAPRLRWVAFWNAGIDHSLTPLLEQRMREGLQVTNASGMHGAQMAEHAMAMVLAFTRGLPEFGRLQREGRWRREPSIGGIVEELAGQTMGIVGLGHIGHALAARAEAFELVVRGVRSSDGPEVLDAVLAESDHVVLLVPLTDATRGLIDARRLELMKPTARLYNLARGPVVDEPALIAALQRGTIAGAGLDVFVEEPLPAESPFWSMPNVIVTPHAGGATPRYFRRAAQMFVENLARLRRGEELRQRHDVDRGY